MIKGSGYDTVRDAGIFAKESAVRTSINEHLFDVMCEPAALYKFCLLQC